MIDESELRRRLEEDAHTCYEWSNGPGTVYPSHSHSYRKLLYCLKGSIRFELVESRENVELGPGDRLDLRPGLRHAAVVGPEGVTCVEGQARDPGA